MFSKAILNKKIVHNFMKDKLSMLTAYFANTGLIILFFHLFTDGQIAIRYPLVLSVFVLIIFLTSELFRYSRFYNDLHQTIDNPDYDITASTYEQKQVKTAIHKIHHQYINKMSMMEKEEADNNRFLSQWIHNMKTPVSVIDLILQKLKEKDESHMNLIEELEEENHEILDNLEQTLNMVRLKEFSRDYVPESMGLHNLLKNIIKDNKKQFIYNNVFPIIDKCEDEVYILSDVKWTRFMIEQIISNGIKYSSCADSSKQLFITITTKGKYSFLTIRDEGIGIPEYDIKKIYEPFFTGENGRLYKNSTGIGLYLCKLIADKLGHELSIDSIKGQGTTVVIKFLSKL